MLYSITARDRGLMHQNKLAFVDTAMSWVAPTVIVLMARWAQELGPVKVAMLVAITHMTLGNGRPACELPLTVFGQGNVGQDECPVFTGLGMSLNSARTHLEALCRDDFVNVYRVLAVRGDAEMSARIVEINFKKLFSAAEIAQSGLKLQGITPSKFWRGPYEYIHGYFVPSLSSFGLGKPNQTSPAFGAATTVGEGPVLATPKKSRTPARVDKGIEDVVSFVTQRRQERTERYVASASTALTAKAMQALLDKAMAEYLPRHPRVIVTAKPFGVMRKRLVEAKVEDVPDLIDYTIRMWFTLSSQNRAAYLKDPSKGTPLPASPSFTVLAYKLPYFIAAYSNHLADRNAPTREQSALERRALQAEQAVAQLREQNAKLRSSRPVARPRPTPAARVEPINKPAIALEDDWIPPAWDAHEKKKEGNSR